MLHTPLDAYEGYIFDLDGTLADSAGDVIAALHASLTENAIPDRPISRDLIGPPLADMYRTLLGDIPDALVERLVLSFRTAYNVSGMPQTRLFPGIPPVLDKLSARGARVFVATNKVRASTDLLLDRLGVLDRFEAIMCSDSLFAQTGRLISKAEMIRAILDTGTIAPSAAIMIGDSPHDVKGGLKAGVHTLGILYGYGQPEDILAAGPEWTVADPDWREYLA